MGFSTSVLSADHLGKSVASSDGYLTILHDICFDIQSGESVAITGSSGSGKSTLLGLLAGLDLPSMGSVTLMGQNLNDLDEDGRAQLRSAHVGFVFQSFQLLPHLSALENVMLPAQLSGLHHAKERATEWLKKLAYRIASITSLRPCRVVSSNGLRWLERLLQSPRFSLRMSPPAASMKLVESGLLSFFLS
jgi:putative ABC transport system ATP-binding protein